MLPNCLFQAGKSVIPESQYWQRFPPKATNLSCKLPKWHPMGSGSAFFRPGALFQNVFVGLIDFDLAICPYDILRDSETTKRQNALHRPWLQLIMGNYSRSTEEYVHWSNLMESVPKYIQEDSDLFQLYSVFRYFEHHNKKLVMLTSQLRRETNKEMFLKKSSMILKSLRKYNIQF